MQSMEILIVIDLIQSLANRNAGQIRRDSK